MAKINQAESKLDLTTKKISGQWNGEKNKKKCQTTDFVF